MSVLQCWIMNFETIFEVMTKIDITERFDTSHPLRENFDARHERKNKRKIKEKQKGIKKALQVWNLRKFHQTNTLIE